MRNWQLYWNTVRYLKRQQLVYQVVNRFRARPSLVLDDVPPVGHWLAVVAPDKPRSLNGRTFTFLNQSATFPNQIDWNYSAYGKLWQYNLNYFDFLNQPGMDAQQGVGLIQEFMDQTATVSAGLEPYPVSLRIMNWIRFLSHHHLLLPDIDGCLWAQVRLLEQRLEYHLLGNHLLENGFALLLAALYFQNRSLYQKAAKLVKAQLGEQLCCDGGHYERSPMYHQILLDRLLDCCYALKKDSWHNDTATDAVLSEHASRMLGWLEAITLADGTIPLMNDAAEDIAPTTHHLSIKCQTVGISAEQMVLSDSGFRQFCTPAYEMVANIGSVGPDYQPGHAHADTFNFVLQVQGKPVLIDAGVSTYEASERRQWERSTAAHNTVQIGNLDSSEVWGGFRVGRRARVTILEDQPASLRARHDGYQHLGIAHERHWLINDTKLDIIDTITGDQIATARFSLDPEAKPLATGSTSIRFSWGTMAWENALTISLKTIRISRQFNQLLPTRVIEVEFKNRVRTTVSCAA
ncbi:heparinase II/III domain-containing protein [Larkinella sp. VNQ87]|uniref:heparinase II/III domain-containing protein n=1 Tax=Larkinella sp. VNQ87 TaxID=3400921 RepID=UPI003C11F5D5